MNYSVEEIVLISISCCASVAWFDNRIQVSIEALHYRIRNLNIQDFADPLLHVIYC